MNSKIIKPTKFQEQVLQRVSRDKSLLLVAPTGLGKTFAVTGDLKDQFCKTIYAVPLRALSSDIHRTISSYKRRNGETIEAVIHHGNAHGSTLFGEEFIATTYDQIVCGIPGLPLSLPLKAGHAVAGALLMSRLILDETHLAWTISDNALSILLAIVKFRQSFGLQTILMTATLPKDISTKIRKTLGIEEIIVGDEMGDESLALRNKNRSVTPELIELKKPHRKKDLNFEPLDNLLINSTDKRIYFANTVDRLQQTYDRLISAGVNANKINILHNRMPSNWRKKVEKKVHNRFGKNSENGDWILLTNQVAEAGLDISAPLVVSDPAPVDTLVQRAGRCARWFRSGITEGKFIVLKSSENQLEDYAKPYRTKLVKPAIEHFEKKIVKSGKSLTWEIEREWINETWGGDKKKASEAVEKSLNEITFALNLFDRAAQEQKPGMVANAFREILSIEVAIGDDLSKMKELLNNGYLPETSSISMKRAYTLRKNAKIIRYDREENQLQLENADTIHLGDLLILPSSVAYLHSQKGLCFGNGQSENDKISLCSEWHKIEKKNRTYSHASTARGQSLSEHTQNVMKKTFDRLMEPKSLYRQTLIKILCELEGNEKAEGLADFVANLTQVAVAFHDLGKADIRWQKRIREFNPDCPEGLIARSTNLNKKRIGIPHAPPGYTATVEACRLLLGYSETPSQLELIKSIALATCRHHSSSMNPSQIKNYKFEPHQETIDFVREMFLKIGANSDVVSQAKRIVDAAEQLPEQHEVPLMLPNVDLFPIYALVGRAILMADREDASGKSLEVWK